MEPGTEELHPVIYYRTISTEKLQIEISLCDKHATSCAAELYHSRDVLEAMLLNPKQPTRASALGGVVICSKKTVCLEKTSLPRLRSLKNEQAHSPSSFHTKVPGQTMLRVVVLWACVAASLAWVNTLISSSPAPPLTLMTDEGVQGYISRRRSLLVFNYTISL